MGFGSFYFEIMASRGDGPGGNHGLLGFLGVVVYRSRPGGASGRFGWGGGLKRYSAVIKLVLIWGRRTVLL